MKEKTHIVHTSIETRPQPGSGVRDETQTRAVLWQRNLRSTILSLAAVVAIHTLSCLEARADLLAYEGFNYSAGSGNLSGQSGGFGWSGAWQTVNNGASGVQSGSLAAGANAPAGYDSLSTGNSVFTPNNTRSGRFLDTSAGGIFGVKGYLNGDNIGAGGKTIYISFLQQPNGTTSYYELEFHRGNLGDSGRIGGVGNDSGASTSVFLRVPSAGQTAIGAGSTGASFYVVRIDYLGDSNDTVYVYQNPTSATEPITPTLTKTSAGNMAFNGLSFGCFNNGRTVVHDEIRVGETWADVVSPGGTYSAGNWDGGGADNYWSTAGNWDNNVVPIFASSLTFAGNTRLNSTNDLTGVSVNNLTFDAAAGAFTLAGNSLGLNGNIAFSGNPSAPITQTINLPLTPAGNFSVDTRTNGNITINGDITAGAGSTLTQTSAGNAGTLTLAGTNTVAGLVINGGTNRITGRVNVNLNNTRFALANASSSFNATMIIEEGASLTVSGTGVDAGVIGRDGGVGTVIQNGGTFSFNIPNNNKLFIVATGNANSRGSYNMNGGLFDMNNNILSPGLGAGGVTITGMVNQAGGVITNVGQLVPGWNPGQNGRGIYNLTGGSMYINGIGGVGITSQSGKYDLNLGGGTIAAGASWSSALDMTLTGSNGPVTFNPNGNAILLSGVLSGPGGLKVSGGGILELSGANTYTGDTLVEAGSTLQFDVTGSSVGALRVTNGALLNLNYSGTYAVGSFYTNGVALPVGTYHAGNLPDFIIGGGNLQVSSGISAGYWTGGGADSNWSTAGNWDNNAVPIFPHALFFTNGTQLANNNDLNSIAISSLTFGASAGAFTLGGNDVTLSGGIGFDGNPAAPVTQTVNLGMTFTGNQTINLPANGNLILGGSIASGYNLVKAGSGTLTLGGASDAFNSFIVNGGTNVITGNVSITGAGGGSYFFIGDIGNVGALVIQPGATLTVNGGFADSGVLGRDSGSGTVIQNGGTFNFAPANVGYLFVGASSSSATRAEYHLNGGMLDMNNLTLAVALSANGGTIITGVVEQAGGIINNVAKLDLGAFNFGPGRGIYHLRGGTINLGGGGIGSDSGSYEIHLGGGTVGAYTSWASPLNMTLTGTNGPVTFDTAGNIINLTGILSGTGGLVVTGGGVLELGGANSYSGDTTVNAGMLQLDVPGSSAGAFRLTNGASLILNYSGTYLVAGCYTNGTPLPNGIYNAANLPDFITGGSGDLQVVGGVSTGVWDGGGADNNWSTAGNWDANAVPVFPIGVTFAGNSRLTNTNDLVGLTINSITFDSAAGPFTVHGNDITLPGPVGFNGNPASPVTQTVNLGLTWTADQTVDLPANGNLSLGGNIMAAANTLTKINNGTLTLGGANTLAGLIVNGGTSRITGATTITGTGGTRFCLANANTTFDGTLIIENGAILSVGGTFVDAGVIGRDGGVGTVVQNGGDFLFDIANHPYLFVGAGDNSSTRGTYNLNGGVLDMTGKSLGIGLGASGAAVTGVVNQVSGVITNVDQLILGFNPGQNGRGIYHLTGGSLYLGSGGIQSQTGNYEIYLGGGTIGALASWSSPLNLTLTGINGPVAFDPAGNTVTLLGSLSGSGALTVAGSGVLELSGVNSYTGDTLVNGGTLKLNSTNNSSSTIKVANGATLNLNFAGTMVTGGCYTNNISLPAGTYNAGNLPGFITGAGSLQVTGSIPTTPTPLSVSVSGGSLSLSWPANYQGWILQTQTNPADVGLNTNWADVPGSASLTSTNLPIDPSAPTVFYRLRYPAP